MQVGVGLPTTLRSADRELILEWARRADRGPFSSLGVFDRLAYHSYDPLITLAAVATITERIRLATTILTAPLHNTVLLAKAVASLDVLSGGRLVLGLAVGARDSDYQVAGVNSAARGKRLAEQMAALRAYWEADTLGPKPVRPGGPEMLVGGLSDAVFSRVARYANGYLHGGGPPRAFARAAEKARAAWTDAARPDKLLLWGMGYYALGEDAREAGDRYMKDYYAFTGPFAEKIAAGLLTTPQAVREFLQGYQEAGCDELVLFPTVANLRQFDRLAEVIA